MFPCMLGEDDMLSTSTSQSVKKMCINQQPQIPIVVCNFGDFT